MGACGMPMPTCYTHIHTHVLPKKHMEWIYVHVYVVYGTPALPPKVVDVAIVNLVEGQAAIDRCIVPSRKEGTVSTSRLDEAQRLQRWERRRYQP